MSSTSFKSWLIGVYRNTIHPLVQAVDLTVTCGLIVTHSLHQEVLCKATVQTQSCMWKLSHMAL